MRKVSCDIVGYYVTDQSGAMYKIAQWGYFPG